LNNLKKKLEKIEKKMDRDFLKMDKNKCPKLKSEKCPY
jgi:hypothetical protein